MLHDDQRRRRGARGAMTVADVLAASAGLEPDKAIDAWCGCVWKAFGAAVKLL